MNKTIYLLRHAETDFNKRGIVQGRGVNTSINAFGKKQAMAFFRAYKDVPFDLAVSSALQRTHQTIEPFIQLGISHEIHDDIDEISWGDHEGKPPQPGSRNEYTSMREGWLQGNYDFAVSNGESAAQLSERVARFINHIRKRPESTVLICSHGRTIRCMMTQFEDVPLNKMDNYVHSNTGLYKIEQKGEQFTTLLHNDDSHLSQIIA